MSDWTEEEEKETYREYMRKAKRPDGRCPGRKRFEKDFGVPPGRVDRLFGTHNNLIIAVGGIPNEPKRKIPDEEVFRGYAEVCRSEGEIPTQPRLKYWTSNLHTPTSGIAKGRNYPAFKAKFREWCIENSPEYDDILGMIGWERESFGKRIRVTKQVPSISRVRYPYLPAGLIHLDVLALDRLPEGYPTDKKPSLLFEWQCGDAFRAMGFQVRKLGQGTGRKADSLALTKANSFGVIIDAKARSESFVLTANEQRKVAEYTKRHLEDLKDEGIERIYYCIVSSRFRQEDEARLTKTLARTGLKGWCLWTVDDLMKTLDRSIENRATFKLTELEEKFRSNRIV